MMVSLSMCSPFLGHTISVSLNILDFRHLIDIFRHFVGCLALICFDDLMDSSPLSDASNLADHSEW